MVKIIRYGLSGNPVTLAHARIVEILVGKCKKLIVAVCGPRDDKETSRLLSPADRAALAVLGFPDLPQNVELDLADLGRINQKERQSTYVQMKFLRDLMKGSDLWLAVGTDQVRGGRLASSEIQLKWIFGQRLWNEFGFYVFHRPGYELDQLDCPPLSKLLAINMDVSSSKARKAAEIGDRDALLLHVNEQVADYILSRGLYRAS